MDIPFDQACAIVASALEGSARREIVDDFASAATLGSALKALRDAMRANQFRARGHQIFLDRAVRSYDGRTRAVPLDSGTGYDGEIRHVLAVCAGRERPRATLAEAVGLVRMLEAEAKSLALGRPVRVR